MIQTAVHSDSAVTLVDGLVAGAIKLNASDIHLESTDKGLRVRYRIDGVLYDQQSLPLGVMPQIVSRIKILSHINIAEKRVPQDGKFTIKKDNKTIDFRVATFPALQGEKVVIRILDRSHQSLHLDQLGFTPLMLIEFKELISRSSGFLLVTGPTGSGKTTTLYAALMEIASAEKHIITLEDPVEYNIEGITQGQIHPDAGFSFEKGIRAMLRQDPDIVMVGEIRDKQTAHIAIEAALTGHLVLSTLHTNDAPAAIMRLMDMGIEPFLINASVTGVLAQRLVRKICTSCRISYKPAKEDIFLLNKLGLKIETLYKGVGCAACFKLGYKGRIGIYELLTITNQLRALIVQQPIFETIYLQALKDGMSTLLTSGAQKVKDGVISLQELARAVC